MKCFCSLNANKTEVRSNLFIIISISFLGPHVEVWLRMLERDQSARVVLSVNQYCNVMGTLPQMGLN